MADLAWLVAAAVTVRTLYPANHPRVTQAIGHILAALQGSTTFLIVGDDLVVGPDGIRHLSLPQRQFMQAPKRRGIERLTLAEGLDAEECQAFIQALATGETTPESTAHLIVGRVAVGFEDQRLQMEGPHELSVDQVEVVREAFARFRIDG